MDKITASILPEIDELRSPKNEISSDAMTQILTLFDDNTFVEMGRGVLRPGQSSDEQDVAGVITGYGSIDGAPVFAFAQDLTRSGGSVDSRHADKIVALYKQALRAGAPIVGIFDSNGVDVRAGLSACVGYGRIITAFTEASGRVPQIAIILGECRGLLAAAAATFDFLIREPKANFGARNGDIEPLYASVSKSRFGGTTYARELLSYLPPNTETGILPQESADSLNRRLPLGDNVGDVRALISSLADNNMALEVYANTAQEALTFFSQIGGVRCGVFASVSSVSRGELTLRGVQRLSRFIEFCGTYGIPLVSLTDSAGLAPVSSQDISFAEALARLTRAYTAAPVPKIGVVTGKAIGVSAVLFGTHASGADIVYATEGAEIGALSTASAVAFAWNDKISQTVSRQDLEKEWRASIASPAAAAAIGEIDDIIAPAEIRKRVASALLLLTTDGTLAYRRRKNGG